MMFHIETYVDLFTLRGFFIFEIICPEYKFLKSKRTSY